MLVGLHAYTKVGNCRDVVLLRHMDNIVHIIQGDCCSQPGIKFAGMYLLVPRFKWYLHICTMPL